ncbi:MAG TPA: alpha-glucan family phosphorylase, partial [Solirubrobacteraceae bacterium]|nr:alpha-glucan family phosphorylase [Solirubrobacteraceae bacterium]
MPPATAIRYDGHEDIGRSAAELAARLPEPLAPLARLAFNYRWSWLPGGPELFAAVDAERFALCAQNPVRLLQESSALVLRRAAEDETLIARARELDERVTADLERPPAEPEGPVTAENPVAYLSAEYGVHVSLPVYSGGLGALAGDFLKEASDRALPLVAVGLMYRKGYFRQRIDASGWQHEYWIETDPQRLPAALVTAADDSPLTLSVPIGEGDVTARIWRVDVGRIPLFLLDTDCPENGPLERWITGRLYDGDPQTRLAQYALLGVGGIRALRAMGYGPAVIHLNEGHAALAPLELAHELADDGSARSLADALERARARTVFTTHTPVAAGNDTYPADEIESAIGRLSTELGYPMTELIALGHDHGAEASAPFGVTQAALRMSRTANAVSRRHGDVAREMWNPLWPDHDLDDVPIGHVTNGVHVPTWLGPPMRELLDRHLPEGWCEHSAAPEVWEAAQRVPSDELWATRHRQRSELVEFVRARSVADRLGRGDLRGYVDAAARAFDPEVLTIGFARRVATYKRLDLLIRDPDWTLALLAGERPVQVVLAGKAHPRDEEAKRVLQSLFGLKAAKVIGERVVFLDDYDLYSAARLVRGCDVWLNVPRPPLEASGTSGMKSVFNGGLQLSVLDGWWAEAYDPDPAHPNGWAIPGDVDPDHGAQDERDAGVLHHLLEDEVVPTFYERDEAGLPQRWLQMVRTS